MYEVDDAGVPVKCSGSHEFTQTIKQADKWGQPVSVYRVFGNGDVEDITIDYYGQGKVKSVTTSASDDDMDYVSMNTINEDGSTQSVSSSWLYKMPANQERHEYSQLDYEYSYDEGGRIDSCRGTYIADDDDRDKATIYSSYSVEYDEYGNVGTVTDGDKWTNEFEYEVIENPSPWLRTTSGGFRLDAAPSFLQ